MACVVFWHEAYENVLIVESEEFVDGRLMKHNAVVFILKYYLLWWRKIYSPPTLIHFFIYLFFLLRYLLKCIMYKAESSLIPFMCLYKLGLLDVWRNHRPFKDSTNESCLQQNMPLSGLTKDTATMRLMVVCDWSEDYVHVLHRVIKLCFSNRNVSLVIGLSSRSPASKMSV